jgi:IclR family transcriptional regulator, KDG regulon repressor
MNWHEETGETIHLAQMDLGRSCMSTSATPRSRWRCSPGRQGGPAYCTGVGKAMLAYLPPEALEAALAAQSPSTASRPTRWPRREALKAELEAIRARGHAFDREEHEAGIICCAVPILTRRGG